MDEKEALILELKEQLTLERLRLLECQNIILNNELENIRKEKKSLEKGD